MRHITVIIMLLLLCGLLRAEDITPEKSRDIIQQITMKYTKMYKKYKGVQSTRHLEIKWYKPSTNELVKTEKVDYIRYDDFYEDLQYKTLNYEVDGKKEDPESYNPHEGAPGIPIFDDNGFKQYDRNVVGIETIDGKNAYKISVNPRKPQTTHFKGYVWVTVDGLEIVQTQGSAGKFRIGLQELSVFFKSKDFGDYYAFTSGATKARISFFIFQPERWLHFNFYATDIKPMPK